MKKRNFLLPDGRVIVADVVQPEAKPEPKKAIEAETRPVNYTPSKKQHETGGLFGSSGTSSMLRLAIFGII